MNHISRGRLIRQGFTNLSDEDFEEFGPWLRLAPAVCALGALAGTALENGIVFWALASLGAIAAVRRKHPADLVYDLVIRRWLGREERLPQYGAPRRFAGGLASAGFVAAGLAFLLGARTLGIVIGASFGGVMLLAATTDICMGCNIYHLFVPERVQRRGATRSSVRVMLTRRNITGPRLPVARRPSRVGSRVA